MTGTLRQGGLAQRLGAIVAVAALGVGTVAFLQQLDTPPDILNSQFDGRTWLELRDGTANSFILANGITGFVEAKAEGSTDADDAAAFIASTDTTTLLGSRSQLYAVADGSHGVETFDGGRGNAALLPAGLVLAGDTVAVRRLQAEVWSDPIVVSDDTEAVGDADVVGDGTQAWVLRARGDRRVVLRIGTDLAVAATSDAPSDTTGLLLVDGRPYLVAGDGYRPVDGGGSQLPRATGGGMAPMAVFASGGMWALGDGTRLTVTAPGTPQRQLSAPAPVRSIAVWHGRTWFTTDDGLFWVEGDEVNQVELFRGAGRFFIDGGRLWATADSFTASIDRLQQPTVFDLSSYQFELCAGGCTAEQAQDFLDEQTTTTAPADDDENDDDVTTTTEAPPDLSLPNVIPTTSTDPAVKITTTTAQPTENTEGDTVPPENTEVIDTTIAPVETTAPPITDPPPPPDTDPPPPVTDPPPPPAGLVLYFNDNSDPLTGESVDVTYGYTGSSRSCDAGDQVGGTLSWNGSGSPRDVSLPRGRNGQSGTESLGISPGDLTVTLTMCGATTSISRFVGTAEPWLGAISVSGQVEEGGSATASAQFFAPSGWTANPTWSFGAGGCPAGSTIGGDVSGNRTSASLSFPSAGTYCVSLIVSFVADGNAIDLSSDQAMDASATTTTVDETTTTTVDETTTTAVLDTTTTVVPDTTTTTVPDTTTTVPDTTTTTTTTAPPVP